MTTPRYSHSSPADSGPPTRSQYRSRSAAAEDPEPWRPDWLMILMVSLFVLTLLIAWLVDIPALLRN